jgi:hypothetical protein
MEAPQRTRPLLDVVRDASALAKQFLRTGKSSAGAMPETDTVPVMNGGQRTDAEQRLASLLKRQVEIAEDVTPAGDAAYQRIVSEIAQVQAEITATKQMEAQRG